LQYAVSISPAFIVAIIYGLVICFDKNTNLFIKINNLILLNVWLGYLLLLLLK